MKPVELRCELRLHGRLLDGLIEVKCHPCTKMQGKPVYHYYDAATGEPVDVCEVADKAA